MQKLDLKQSLGQRLSVKQIQFIKLLQIPGYNLSERIQQEIENNPLLEEEYSENNNEQKLEKENENETDDKEEDVDIEDYINQDDFLGYKMEGDGSVKDNKEIPIPKLDSYIENLERQFGLIRLSKDDYIIGKQIIGSIDENGYMLRNIKTIINDLAFLYNIFATPKRVNFILKKIQLFEPAGVGARNLQECLIIQIKQIKDESADLAFTILNNCFEEFKKKHYEKIQKKLNITKKELKNAIELILKLNPKPIQYQSGIDTKTQYLKPDFLIKEVRDGFTVELIDDDILSLKINDFYLNILKSYQVNKTTNKETKETVTFIKQKLDSAKWFIDAINQRRDTLIKTMTTIVNIQKTFFETGNIESLKPMILKNVADIIEMDISTVSRVVNSKSAQTKHKVFMLKQLFSESIETIDGKQVSNKKVKYILQKIIDKEDKNKPLSDEQLELSLNDKGFVIARRTIAKYREQLHIPVARLRKKL